MRRDPVTQLFILTKQPWEEDFFGITFKGKLTVGDALSSVVEVQAENLGRVVDSIAITQGQTQVEGDQGYVHLSGGSNGEWYKIHMRCVTASGRKLERDFIVEIVD